MKKEEEEERMGAMGSYFDGLSPLRSFLSHVRLASPLSFILQKNKLKNQKNKKKSESERIENVREEMKDGLILLTITFYSGLPFLIFSKRKYLSDLIIVSLSILFFPHFVYSLHQIQMKNITFFPLLPYIFFLINTIK